jgi:acetyl/propionyl-CoA carboxylase alpha subunit
MKEATYKEMSKTAEGRKQAHEIMLQDIRTRMDAIIAKAPTSSEKREKAAAIMDAAFAKMQTMGNGNLFAFLADDSLSDRNFIYNVDATLKGKIY